MTRFAVLQALAFERLLLVVKTQPVTQQPASRPRLAELKPVNENITVNYAARQSDAQQRIPLEPLFHINTDAVAAAEPMSIDAASVNLSSKPEGHGLAATEEAQAPASLPASDLSLGAGLELEAPVKAESLSPGPVHSLGIAFPGHTVCAALLCAAWPVCTCCIHTA